MKIELYGLKISRDIDSKVNPVRLLVEEAERGGYAEIIRKDPFFMANVA